MPTNPHRPAQGPGGPRRRISQPMILATAFVLTASGGIGASAASAATPVNPPSETPVPTVTATETITGTPTAAPTEIPTAAPAPVPTAAEVPLVGPFLGALHGEVVVPSKDQCSTVTVFTQTGQAVAVAEDSITVRSQDGFERSYAIDDSTRVFTGRRGGEIRQDAWVSVIAAVQPGTQTPAPESPAPIPSTTPTAPEATPTAPEATPTVPEATPTAPEATPTVPEATPTVTEATPAPSESTSTPTEGVPTPTAPVSPSTTTPTAPQGETAAAAYVFDLSRPSKRLWYLGKSSPYSLKWRSGRPVWRTPEPCPTPTVIPTETPAPTPTETTTETAAPTPEPTPTDSPTPTPASTP